MTTRGTDQERFRLLYAANFDPILRYALRRVASPEDAADVVAETFLTAWRRLLDVPPNSEVRLWLFGVARRVVANQVRGEGRRHRLGERLRLEVLQQLPAADVADEVLEVRAAIARLAEMDREILTLSIWEQLAPREIAEVLGLSAPVVRTRLSRARSRLRAELDGDVQQVAGHVQGVPTKPTRQEAR